MTRAPRHAFRRVGVLVVALLTVGLLALIAVALPRLRARARDVPLSPVTGGWFVGPGFVERAGLTTGEGVAGELDDVATLAGDQFEPEALDREIRRFYERTAEYRMRYRVRWHTPFRAGAALASLLTSRVQQLNLPGPGDESWHWLESRFLDVDEPGAVAGDGAISADRPVRENVRAWVRTDSESRQAVFVALYATHHRDGEGFVNIAAPLPSGAVDTVLRPENLDRGTGEGTGIRLTTEGEGDPGLYLRTTIGAFEVPGGQSFSVWREGGEAETEERNGDRNDDGNGDLRANHEMWLLGRTFLTVEYQISRESSDDEA